MDYYLISNMYPTKDSPGYGSFVKNVSDALTELGIEEKIKSVIKGRSKSIIDKIRKYLCFYSSILVNYWKKYDFIYIHFPNQAVPLLLPLLYLSRRKLVVNLHGEDLVYSAYGYGNKLGKLMEKMCKKYADAIVVPSEYFKKIVQDRHLIDSSRIIVSASGGINSSIFFPKDGPKNNSLIHLGYVGRMETDKGIIEFLETCKKLKEEGKPFRATAIGYGSYYGQAQMYVNQKRLEMVKLIPGLPQNELGDYYRSFDLLIFSSSRTGESLGLTGIEALACGTPVIGSNLGGIATYIKQGYNGWLTSVGDVCAIVECISDYMKLPAEKKELMYDHAVQTGKEYYTSEVCAKLAKNFFSIITT